MNSQRILIFNVNWLGDVLFSTATIRNLRRRFPEGYIACIIPSRCYPVLKGNPCLDEIIIFDEKDRHRGIMAKLAFIRQLKRKKFDTVFLLHRSFTRAFICWLAGIPQRIGYAAKRRGVLLTHKIPPLNPDSLHRIDYYLTVIEKAGVRPEDRFLDFYYSQEDEYAAAAFLKKHLPERADFLVGINPGGNWLPKRWPPKYWARLADLLIGTLKAEVVITGSPDDFVLGQTIQSLMRQKAINACGALSLKQSAALFKKLDVFVSADSGPLHIANAVKTKKIIALFGPTSVEITAPFPLQNVVIMKKPHTCRLPCYEVGCPDNRCMQAITPEEVFEKIAAFRGKESIHIT
ncbi:MAG: lipopolysaccharide heptosyltransferase II [Candidatus Omnitrophica bacterium]|nr:lipopolysaccharide heptosyltransferase II [Candidatus Omnitrophota bacterium]